MRDSCQYPMWEPSRGNPAGDCGRTPAPLAAPLGDTGVWLALCEEHARHRLDAIPSSEVPER